MLDPEGNIINWNMSAQRIRHYRASESGQHFSRFYTEEEQQQALPAKHAHFVWTGNEEVIIQVQYIGPAGIDYINPADDPRKKTQ